MDLIDEHQLTVFVEAEFVLRIGQHQPGAFRHGRTMSEDGQRRRAHVRPHFGINEAADNHVGHTQRLIVATGLCLGRRCDDRCWEQLVLLQTIGQTMSIDRPLAVVVSLPQRGSGHASDGPTDDHFDREGNGRASNQHIGIGHGDGMMRHEVVQLAKPPPRQLVQHLPFTGNAAKDAIKSRQPIGGHEQTLMILQCPANPHLSGATPGERKLEIVEHSAREPFTGGRHRRSTSGFHMGNATIEE